MACKSDERERKRMRKGVRPRKQDQNTESMVWLLEEEYTANVYRFLAQYCYYYYDYY